MKKHIARILLCFSIVYVYAGTALEFTVPEFEFGVLIGKKPNAQKFDIFQKSFVDFRLLYGERFYSDLALSFYIPDILRFFHPNQQIRTLGAFALSQFSLNFPRLGGNFLSLSLFTGNHPSLSGYQYSFDFLKHRIRPVRMHECMLASGFLPVEASENIGVSFAGLITNSSYLGASFGWSAHVKHTQEYGLYMQGGAFSNMLLTNGFLAFHITERAKEISLTAGLSLLFPIQENFSIYTQVGLHKTDFRHPELTKNIVRNIHVFFEPRIHLHRMNFDFTFFVSSFRDRQRTNAFPTAPLLIRHFNDNEFYSGLNIFCGFGNMETDKLQGGFHLLTAMSAENQQALPSFLLTVTPFFTMNIGTCDLDLRADIFPYVYATPAAMFEGKITLKRNF